MTNILVTGGAGFIGSHIVDALIGKDFNVIILDDLSSGSISNIESKPVTFFEGDIRDKTMCNFVTKNMDYVLHLAALKSVPKSLLYPDDFNNVNIQGTLNLLQACIKNKVKRFVFSSSSSVYGDVTEFPQKEDKLSFPLSPYALTKLAGEYYCKIYSKYYGLDTVSLRYFNVFGERQPVDDDYAGAIPKFITTMIANNAPTIYGNGKQSRDFTYVKNIVNANLLAIKTSTAFNGETYNIAGGQSISINDVVTYINYLLNKNIRPQYTEIRNGDIFKSQANITKTIEQLGDFMEISFFEGLAKTINYWREKCSK